MKKILVEALVIDVVALALSLAANVLSPQGLKLSRNSFPAAKIAATNGSGVDAGVLQPVAPSNSAPSTLSPQPDTSGSAS